MINTSYTKPETKYNGAVHNRKDELKSYRKAIDIANSNMINAACNGDFQTAENWSKLIDRSQQQIFSIITQETEYGKTIPESYDKLVKTTTGGLETITDSCVNLQTKGLLHLTNGTKNTRNLDLSA